MIGVCSLTASRTNGFKRGTADRAIPEERRYGVAVQGYFAIAFLRFLLSETVTAGVVLASWASLASLSMRRRSMFFRIAIASFSMSAIARTPSSRASRCRLARAMLTGEGWADLLLAISSYPNSEPSGPLNPLIERAHRRLSTSVKRR